MHRRFERGDSQNSGETSERPTFDFLKKGFKDLLKEQKENDQVKIVDKSRAFLMREGERYLSDMNSAI